MLASAASAPSGASVAAAAPSATSAAAPPVVLLLRAHHLERHLAADLLDVLLQVAHARLAAVPADELLDRLVLDLQVTLLEPHVLPRVRLEVPPRDLDLLVEHVAGEAHHLHPVEERAGDRVDDVGGAQEEHLREVDGHVEV